MKHLFLLCMALLGGSMTTTATTPAEDLNYRAYTNSFIFVENGIEFAVFPDGQFDFNYLEYGPNVNVSAGPAGTSISFNTGFQYDRFVQYDTYGAVIQIENTPIYYDSWGRVAQIGNININYRNGFVNRLGGLRVFYNAPGVIGYHRGFINPYNRLYVYQPWHSYYAVPAYNSCVVFNQPYRRFYNPVRYNWGYHRAHWNSPYYYNGAYLRSNSRRAFYRPSDRVVYREFERGRRNSRGLAVSTGRSAARERSAIATGTRRVDRTDRARIASIRSNRANSGSNNRSAVATRDSRAVRSNTRATTGTRAQTADNSRVASTRSATTRTSRTRNESATIDRTSRSSSANRSADTSRSSSRSPFATSNRTSRNTQRATTSRTSNRSTATRSNRSSSSSTATRTATRSARTRS